MAGLMDTDAAKIMNSEDSSRKRGKNMSNNSNSNSSSNRMQVPEAKEAMNRFKMEVASELNVPLKEGYNGNLTSAQNGSVGGEMVRQMIKKQEESMSSNQSAQ